MDGAMTRVTVNLTRHESATFEFEGVVEHTAALELVQSGDYEPVVSKIHHEDVDVVELRTVGA